MFLNIHLNERKTLTSKHLQFNEASISNELSNH